MQLRGKTRKLVVAAVLCGLALALSLVDSAVSSFIPFLPGFKLGLANIVSLFALYSLGLPYTLLICVVRSALAAMLSGNITMLFFSLAGGIASILVMFALKKAMGIIKVSVTGAITHNILQVLVAIVLTATPQTLYYLPILIAVGAASGFAMGVLCKQLLQSKALKKHTAAQV